MMKPALAEAINKQINAEFYSAFLYLSMANFLESKGLGGMGAWMATHFEEESRHATKLINYMHGRGARVELAAIAAPQTDWDSPRAVFEDALAHEFKATGLINDLMDLALKERDHAATSFLQWFVDEQVEEEAAPTGVVDRLRLVGDTPQILYMLDRELASRE